MADSEFLPEGEAPVVAALAHPPTRGHPPGLARHARGLVRFLYTHNPLYVISAGLTFWGLRVSFDARGQSPETGILMAGLTGYTLLLAAAACALVRFGKLWDDVRTILLVIVLLMLVISLTFDESLVNDSAAGARYFLGGLAFALLLSEGLLRGMPLVFRARFRVPFYSILSLFFIYPIVLSPFVDKSGSPELHWGLFCFPLVAGVLFLTLLPAVRGGAKYVCERAAPWQWPWYPWVLFGLLGLGVCVRSYILCWGFHPEREPGNVFRPYFLAPFLLAASALLLEGGLVSRHRGVLAAALTAPLGIVALAMTGAASASSDLGFLNEFTDRLGASPLLLMMLAVAGFYGLAAVRRVPFAAAGLTAALAASAFCGRETFNLATLEGPHALPILLVGLLQGWLALRRRSWLRGLVAMACLLGAAVLQWHWMLVAAWRTYRHARQAIAGLDLILGGMLTLLAALVVSLSKLGIPQRWLAPSRKRI